MGVSTHAWWCAAGDEVLVLADHRAARLPNAVVTNGRPGIGQGVTMPDGDLVTGHGAIIVGDSSWRVVRWWDPRAIPVLTDLHVVLDRVRTLARAAPAPPDKGFAMALRSSDPGAILDQASRLLGRGPGLTPEGDDVLVGAVAAFRYVSRSLSRAAALEGLDAARDQLLASARSATTRLSTVLLRHALDDEVATPVGALLRSLTGRSDLAAALVATSAIGTSSGPALVGGVVSGAAAACGVAP